MHLEITRTRYEHTGEQPARQQMAKSLFVLALRFWRIRKRSLVGTMATWLRCIHVAQLHVLVCPSVVVRELGMLAILAVGQWRSAIIRRRPFWVPVGFRICQLTFEYVGETLKEYRGKYGKVDSSGRRKICCPSHILIGTMKFIVQTEEIQHSLNRK